MGLISEYKVEILACRFTPLETNIPCRTDLLARHIIEQGELLLFVNLSLCSVLSISFGLDATDNNKINAMEKNVIQMEKNVNQISIELAYYCLTGLV